MYDTFTQQPMLSPNRPWVPFKTIQGGEDASTEVLLVRQAPSPVVYVQKRFMTNLVADVIDEIVFNQEAADLGIVPAVRECGVSDDSFYYYYYMVSDYVGVPLQEHLETQPLTEDLVAQIATKAKLLFDYGAQHKDLRIGEIRIVRGECVNFVIDLCGTTLEQYADSRFSTSMYGIVSHMLGASLVAGSVDPSDIPDILEAVIPGFEAEGELRELCGDDESTE